MQKVFFLKSWIEFQKNKSDKDETSLKMAQNLYKKLIPFENMNVEDLKHDSLAQLLTLLDMTIYENGFNYITPFCPYCYNEKIICFLNTEKISRISLKLSKKYQEVPILKIILVLKCERCGKVFLKDKGFIDLRKLFNKLPTALILTL
ncbi:MAG: hypothetical protein ACTSRL_03020 [Candidatus Helarchaeota archaeon]